MNKKAMASHIYSVIIGIVLFIIVFFAFFGAIRDVLRGEGDFKIVEILTTTIDEIGVQNSGALKLVALQMDEDTGIYIFIKEEIAIIESTNEDSIQLYGSKSFILRPDECDISSNCVCMCNEISFKKASEIDITELKNKYGSDVTSLSQISNLVCEDIQCQSFKSDFVKTITLEQIFNAQTYANLPNKDGYSKWENGFSFGRMSEGGMNYFSTSKYIDVYAVKLTDGTVALCFDPDCLIK